MTHDSSAIRWLGLEIGPQRYAVDLREVSHAIIWPEKVVNTVRGLHNTQGLFVHEGRPIVVVDPNLLLRDQSNSAADAADEHASTKTSAATAPLNSWLVVFRSTPGVVACGIRVNRTVGPFRGAAVTPQDQVDAAAEVEYSGMRWRVVSSIATSIVNSAPNSSHSSAEEILS